MNDLFFNVGDPNFLCLVNSSRYQSFVNEDWDLIQDLLPHVEAQQKLANILMYQMTREGIEEDWLINYYFEENHPKKYIKKAQNYIEVTDNKLYIIDYTCLTMAAQFPDEVMPNKACEPFCIDIENGCYLVSAFLYKDVDTEIKINDREDLAFYFKKGAKQENKEPVGIIWSSI